MTAQEWLERGWHLNAEIEELKETKMNLWERCTGTTPTLSLEPKGGSSNPHKFEVLASLSDEIDRRCEELAAVSSEIFRAICLLPLDERNNKYRRLLQYRYLNFYPFELIAVKMSYTWRHVHRIHSEALEAMEYVIECHSLLE